MNIFGDKDLIYTPKDIGYISLLLSITQSISSTKSLMVIQNCESVKQIFDNINEDL